jgi:hypothetical protein
MTKLIVGGRSKTTYIMAEMKRRAMHAPAGAAAAARSLPAPLAVKFKS